MDFNLARAMISVESHLSICDSILFTVTQLLVPTIGCFFYVTPLQIGDVIDNLGQMFKDPVETQTSNNAEETSCLQIDVDMTLFLASFAYCGVRQPGFILW